MSGSDDQQIIPDVNTNVDGQEGDGDGGVLTISEADFNVAASTQAIVDVNKDTMNSDIADVPYDLLLDDELNGFFDDEDAISTNTDEGRMDYYSDKNNYMKACASSNDDRRGITYGVEIAPTDTTSDFSSKLPVATANQQQQVQEHDESASMSRDFLTVNHSQNYGSEYPIPSENLHHQQSRPTISGTTKAALTNETSLVVSKGNSVVDELSVDDIIIDGVQPTLPWHNEQLDKHHRQAMIRLIITILKARKKENPTQVWMVQLPIKARKLERRLYHSAASLAAYNDRKTLKKRLLDLVRVITVQHHESRTFDNTIAQIQKQQPNASSLFRGSFRSNRAGSVTSQSSIESSSVMSQHQQMMLNRSSFVSTGSIDSLRDLRESVDAKATIESITAKIIPTSRSRTNSVSSKRSATRGDENDKSAKTEGTTNDKKLKESTDAFDMPAPRQRVRSTKGSSRSSTTTKSNPNSRSNSFTSESNANIPTTISATELHRQQQKSINERLQEQIQENIRLQEEIVRKLQQTDQQILMSNSSVNYNNSTTGASQHQQYDQLSMFMNTNDFGSNINVNNSVSLSGHGMASQNAMMSSSTATRNSANALTAGISNPLCFPQQQQQSQQFNTTSNPNPLLFQQQQPLQQPAFLPDMNNSIYNGVDSVRNQILLQQQQQQQQQALSFGGVNSQFQQNHYNALLQQQQLTSLPNLQGSVPGITSGNNNLGMGQQHQQLIQNFANNNTAFTQQQQVAMQMQLMNRSIPSTMSNIPTAQQPQLQMNSLPDNSPMSNINLLSATNTTQPQPTDEQPTTYQNLDASSEPLDTLDWWK